MLWSSGPQTERAHRAKTQAVGAVTIRVRQPWRRMSERWEPAHKRRLGKREYEHRRRLELNAKDEEDERRRGRPRRRTEVLGGTTWPSSQTEAVADLDAVLVDLAEDPVDRAAPAEDPERIRSNCSRRLRS